MLWVGQKHAYATLSNNFATSACFAPLRFAIFAS